MKGLGAREIMKVGRAGLAGRHLGTAGVEDIVAVNERRFSRTFSSLHRGCRAALIDDGGSLVEMAVALPVVMLLITGIVSCGLMLSSYLLLSHATDVGARNFALSRGATTNPCADAVAVIQASAPTIAASNVTYTFKIGSDTFTGNSSGFSGTAASDCSQLGTADMVAGTKVSVTISYPVKLMIYGWTPTNVTLSPSTSEVIE